ncbi:MAG: hypothetical protein A2Y33_02200 [Spirochaetes bacterium GWF1_51_8]|nr:MAG: hypothetical protein A2Y33_02200 [Spirochaetes bacterium GWF1_51_8]
MKKNPDVRNLLVQNREILDHITELVMKMMTAVSDCKNLALRLRNAENDYPFYLYQGYDDEFIRKENSLISIGEDGEVYYDCLCGYMIDNTKRNGDLPLTGFGSFYTNSFKKDWDEISKSLYRPRKTCMKLNLSSAAWVPLKTPQNTKSQACDGLFLMSDKSDLGLDQKKIDRVEQIAQNYAEVFHRIDQIILNQSVRPLKIIIAEDNEPIANLLKRMLSEFGHRITCAPNGEEAWNHIRESRYDLLITDLDMPVMDGFSLIRKIREEYKIYGPRIIVFTGSAVEQEKLTDKEFGISAIVRKPLTDLFYLQRIIRDVFYNDGEI